MPFPFERLEIRVIAISMLDRHPSYQRLVKKATVEMIKAEFDPVLVQLPRVGRRKDGTLHVVDGQHLIEALVQLGATDVQVAIFDSKGIEHEAEIFRKLNLNRKNVNAIEIHRACCIEGDPKALLLDSILAEYGLSVGTLKAWNQIKGVRNLYDALKIGPEFLRAALIALTSAWHGEEEAFTGDIVYGFAKSFAEREDFGNGLLTKVVKKMKTKNPTGGAETAHTAKTLAKTQSGWNRRESFVLTVTKVFFPA